jgi:hypothetical protein
MKSGSADKRSGGTHMDGISVQVSVRHQDRIKGVTTPVRNISETPSSPWIHNDPPAIDYPSRYPSRIPSPKDPIYVHFRTPSPCPLTPEEIEEVLVSLPTQLGIRGRRRTEAVAIQTARVAITHILYDAPVSEAIESLRGDDGPHDHPNQDLIPTRPPQEVVSEVQVESPEPLLVRPRLSPVEEEQPYAPHSPTPSTNSFDAVLDQMLPLLTPASPPRIRTPSPDPLPLYTRDNTPPPPPSPIVEEPTPMPSPTVVGDFPPGVQPGVLPGLDWHYNIVDDGIAVRMEIPDGDDAITIAPFVNIQPNDGSPRVRGTMGLGCPVDDQPLHAEPDCYP